MNIKDRNNVIFIFSLLLGLTFLLWKANYGYIYNDEPFLLGLGYRLVNGDAMIANEWSVMSIVSFLIYPFMYIYNYLIQPQKELPCLVDIALFLFLTRNSFFIHKTKNMEFLNCWMSNILSFCSVRYDDTII